MKVGYLGGLLTFGVVFGTAQMGLAQSGPSNIVPDETLGVERSNVIPNFNGAPIEVITGGAQRGQNLFQSFREFNISVDRGAYFVSDASIRNILARVTGGNRSELLGTLGTRVFANGNFLPSPANLFLINPNGIIFGANSSLDMAASFAATTADAVKFGDRGVFSAITPEAPSSLLTIDPSAFLFNAIAQRGSIINRSTATATLLGDPTFGLQVRNSKTLMLVGGDVTLEGGNLSSVGGQLAIGAVAGTGVVELVGSNDNLQLSLLPNVSRADVIMRNGAFAGTFAGGGIAIHARKMTVESGSTLGTILQAGEGLGDRPAGDVTLDATDQVVVDNATIGSTVLPGALAGTGNIQIQARSVRLSNQGTIILAGEQAQGYVRVNANEEVELDNAFITTGSSSGIGNNGDIAIKAQTISLSNRSQISSASSRQGRSGAITLQAQDAINLRSAAAITSGSNATLFGRTNTEPSGAIQIRAKSLTLSDPSTTITANSFDAARAGDIQIWTDESIVLDNAATISTATSGIGNGGEVQLQTRSLVLSNGGVILSSTNRQGNGGNVQINAADSLVIKGLVIGINPINNQSLIPASGILASTFGPGNAGNVSIDTRQLTLRDSGYISAATGVDRSIQDRNSSSFQGFGQGGQVNIRATESVEVIGAMGLQRSNIDTSTSGNGNAGNLTITTGRFSLRDGASVRTTADADSSGNGGNLVLTATNFTEIVGTSNTPQGNLLTFLTSSTLGSGKAGKLTINTPLLSVREGAQIEAGNRPGSTGAGGDLTINAQNRVEVIGASLDGSTTSITNVTFNDTDAAPLTIQTDSLSLREGGFISTSTLGAGRGGDLGVTAKTVEIIGDRQNGASGLYAGTNAGGAAGDLTISTQQLQIWDGGTISAAAGPDSKGRGGNLTVTATDTVDIVGTLNQDRSQLTVRSRGTGQAGILAVTTPRLSLARGGRILAESGTVNGGDINLTISDLLLMRTGSQISATAGTANRQAPGDGGNIDINARFIIAIPKENSDITANATQGRGGKLFINSQGIFGLKLQPKLTPFSDITASSEVGLNGTISIITPDNSSLQNGLNQLPNDQIDTNKLLAQTCLIRQDKPEGTFYITGTGGIPNRPNDPALSTYPTNTIQPTTQTAQKPWKLGDPIVEPQGFYKLANGRLVMSRECQSP